MSRLGEFRVTTRFHAAPGNEAAVRDLVLGILGPVRREPHCLGVEALVATDEPRLFLITSRWIDESDHVHHRTLAHTREFLAKMEPLVDEPMTSTRATPIG